MIPAALGNIVGGSVFVAFVYWYVRRGYRWLFDCYLCLQSSHKNTMLTVLLLGTSSWLAIHPKSSLMATTGTFKAALQSALLRTQFPNTHPTRMTARWFKYLPHNYGTDEQQTQHCCASCPHDIHFQQDTPFLIQQIYFPGNSVEFNNNDEI